ncbi:MAG: RdgB/HAM1 family non-canonical purine NTP pyrophosphatase [Muribaculaceae bacterium]|nr:RdgB/HAM1 family non-canonical purine NTP pyrophosphatase [Muribaculaceae bacterium]
MIPRTLVFATNNDHKLSELRSILDDTYRVLGLKDIGCTEDIVEDGDTLHENAAIKARYVRDRYGYDCLADDTGLLVDALGGAPGVHTARYAGDSHDSSANMRLLLHNIEDVSDMSQRSARFMTVIALTQGEKVIYFEGTAEGHIALAPRGDKGFGYDPVFIPTGSSLTFAEMEADAKNAISHRGNAVRHLIDYLASNP